jgi:hypothetical protein
MKYHKFRNYEICVLQSKPTLCHSACVRLYVTARIVCMFYYDAVCTKPLYGIFLRSKLVEFSKTINHQQNAQTVFSHL